jgi:hypothetical protein
MSSYAFTPASTYGTTRGGGANSLAADATSSATGSVASAESALTSGWNSVWWDNPLFWLIGAILVFMGYVMFGFNVGAKRVGKASVQVN